MPVGEFNVEYSAMICDSVVKFGEIENVTIEQIEAVTNKLNEV